MNATIHITNLRLRTIIGINDWEREAKQDVVLNIRIEYDAAKGAVSDNIEDTIDYKSVTKAIIDKVEPSSYYLLEKLADEVLEIVLTNPMALAVTVKIDKPGALRFCDTVSVEMSKRKTKQTL